MEIIIGHAQRNILAFASSRSSLFLRKHFPLRKASISSLSLSPPHNSTHIKNQSTSAPNAPLSLTSLESKRKFQKRVKLVNPSKLKTSSKPPPTETTITKQPTVKKDLRIDESITESSPTVKKDLKIDESLFSAESFADLNLPPLLLAQLENSGFTVPTEVQATAVPTISQNHDVIIQSYTGSGKTLAYLLPVLSQVGPLQENQKIRDSDKKQGIEAVIVAPSRELAMQIVREVERLLGPTHKRLVQQLVGGANRSRQEEGLKKNKPLIVVGTPGRIAEISASGKLHTHNCRFLVLDEVDQLLSFNYREDMHRIIEHVGRRKTEKSSDLIGPLVRRSERQTIMVSATVPFSVIRAAMSWAYEPVIVRGKCVISIDSMRPENGPDNGVTQGAINSLPPSLDHYYSLSKAQHKVDTLRRCVHALNAQMVIVFMNNTKPIKDVVYKLEARGLNVAELHGDLSKLTRTTILKRFKEGQIRVLVTNELSARGLDVPECDLVVNFDLPTDSVHYAHRAGRTGRLGRKGIVVSVCEESQVFVMKKLRTQLGVGIKPCEFRDGRFVVRKEGDVE